MLKAPVPKFRSDLSVRLRNIAEKGPREAETDSSWQEVPLRPVQATTNT